MKPLITSSEGKKCLDTSTPLETPLHGTTDHPKIPKQKVGVLVSNLGTPDNYDYWSMRRYLNEFLSDEE